MNKIAIVDIETTGFLNRGGLIVEIGIASLDLQNGEISELYHALVKEEGFDETHRNSWIFKNSNLTHSEVMSAKPLESKKLQEIFNKYPATAYNKKFDFDFLKSRGLKIRELPCPMILATPICKLPGPYGYKYPSVQEAWDIFIGEEYTEEHRGLDDAMHEARIIWELIQQGIFPIGGELS